MDPRSQHAHLAAALVALAMMQVAVGPARAEEPLQSTYAAEAPDIDGHLGDDEWKGATSVTVVARDADTRCIILLMNDEEYLYIAFSAVDDKTNAARARGRQAFDNAAVWFEGSIGFWLYGDGKLRTEEIDADRQRTGEVTTFADGAAAGPPAVKHLTFELLIPMEEVGLEPGASIRIGLHYWDDHDRGPSYWWPAGVDAFSLDSYGTLMTSKKSR